MNIYKVKVKDTECFYDVYTGFIVVGNSINDMLENLYKELFPNKQNIPYYLRSSNFEIKNLGEFIPNDKVKESKVLMRNYINA